MLESVTSTSTTSEGDKEVKRKRKHKMRSKRRLAVTCSKVRQKVLMNRAMSRPRFKTSIAVESLQMQNKQLALSLNEKKMEMNQMAEYINQLKEENLDLIQKNSDLRTKLEEVIEAQGGINEEQMEQEFQDRLGDYLEPVKVSLRKALEHVVGMSTNMEQAMARVSGPIRRSRSNAASSFRKSSTQTLPFPKTSSRSPNAKIPGGQVALVSPRVEGHTIRKPQIEIQRMNMDEVQRIMSNQGRGSRQSNGENQIQHENQEEVEEEQSAEEFHEEDSFEDEGEPLEPQQIGEENATRPFNMSIINEVEDEEESEDVEETNIVTPRRERIITKRRPRRYLRNNSSPFEGLNSPVVLLNDVSSLLDQYDLRPETEDEDDGGEEDEEMSPRDLSNRINEDNVDEARGSTTPKGKQKMMVLVPRLVLESIPLSAKSPRKSKSSPFKAQSTPKSANRESKISMKVEKMRSSGKNINSENSSPNNTVSSTTEELNDTPKTTKKTTTCGNPMEGPSWLFGTNNKPKNSPLAKQILQRIRTSTVSLRSDVDLEAEGLEDETDFEFTNDNEKLKAKNPGGKKASNRKRKTTTASGTPNEDEKATKRQKRVTFHATKTCTPEATTVKTESTPKVTESDNNTPTSSRPRRRAAAAISSFKEPSLTAKVRQGDPMSKSVYDDFKPQAKSNRRQSDKKKKK